MESQKWLWKGHGSSTQRLSPLFYFLFFYLFKLLLLLLLPSPPFSSFFSFFFFCQHSRHVEASGPGTEPELQLWQHLILNPLCHKGTFQNLAP